MKSLNEISAIVYKAARGAGIPLGQAEDLGRVAAYLAGTGGDVRLIGTALNEPQTPVDVQWASDAIDVRSGPVALIGPIVRDALHMGVERAMLVDSEHAALVTVFVVQSGVPVVCQGNTLMRNEKAQRKTPQGPVDIPKAVWREWAQFAARTYVPESDTSRAIGAGAGLTDND